MADLREAESLAATGAATNARVADMADIVPRVCEQTRTCAAGVMRARVALGSRDAEGYSSRDRFETYNLKTLHEPSISG